MRIEEVLWDLEDDLEGNFWHIVVEGHGVSQEEVDEILLNPANPTRVSRSTGRNITFGWTSVGQHLAVVWEEALEDPRTAYPVTAYSVPAKGHP